MPREIRNHFDDAGIDLTPFCWDGPTRPDLQKPVACPDGYTYATNGTIGVLMESTPDDGEHPLRKYWHDHFSEIAETSSFPGLLPPFMADEDEPCPSCDGAGKEVCPYCESTVTCGVCDGTGLRRLTDVPCRNAGWPAALYLSYRYVYLMHDLPGVRLATDQWEPGKPLVFAWEHGFGIVMPLRLSRGEE